MPTDNALEKQIEKMNTFMVNMGFGPLKASEIEPLLKQYSPRKAIRGINKPGTINIEAMKGQGAPMGIPPQGMPPQGMPPQGMMPQGLPMQGGMR